ncbi:protein spire isoform X2 [Planococcus citri]|uniref:protein spire isoform X2 n=1 Tax=Planococcus citri TaxID=170843 RepID=UPI0031F72F44
MSSKNNADVKPAKCMLDEEDSVALSDILISFNGPINEEHAWALCYQCAKCFKNSYSKEYEKCRLVKELDQVKLHREGYVNSKSIVCEDRLQCTNSSERESSKKRKSPPTEQKLIAWLGLVIFQALDFGMDADEERSVSPQLERLLNFMVQRDDTEIERAHPETDDEGIEKDSGDCEDDSRRSNDKKISLDKVLKVCEDHVGATKPEEADSHYRAVCRALVAEALELSSFLEKVSEGTNDLRQKADTEASSEALDNLNFEDWARLWMQVIRELRHGVKLKKVVYSRTPIEYELTPYEILMEDIRSRRYKLNKVMVNGNIPAPVKKDAHAIILEFIRSRPPLKKASERQLPPRMYQATPRERLMESIKQGNIKLRKSIGSTPKRIVPYDSVKNANSENNRFSQRQGSTRRLIKVDYSVIQNTDDDDDDEEEEEEEKYASDPKIHSNSDDLAKVTQQNAMCRTGTVSSANKNSSSGILSQSDEKNLEPYDLATQCPSRKSMRRHTVVCTISNAHGNGSLSVPQSRPVSRNTSTPPAEDSLSYTLPEMSWSRSSLQEELFESKQWQDECLSLTLEEIVHIRSVLTKAELESLPVEGHVKDDVEKRKVCFLCLKTRFSIFGPWGQICKLCSRTVCSKCYSKMRIPTEHFSHVPVVALSPTLLSPVENEYSITNAILSRLNGHDAKRGSVGSAPTSPKLSRASPLPNKMSASFHDGAESLNASPAHSLPEKRRFSQDKSSGRSSKAEKLKGLEMIVCMDCKTMVIQIIKSSRINRSNILHSLTLDLTPVY